MKQILYISLAPFERDARVLRQIETLAEIADVTTCGFGSKPPHAKNHIEIDSNLATLPSNPSGILKLAARAYQKSEFAAPAFAQAHKKLLPQRGDFDLVVASNVRSTPLAFDISDGKPVWVDTLEYAPHENIDDWRWKLLVSGYMKYLCKTYLHQAAWVTAVCPQIAKLYEDEFQVKHCDIVYNAPKYNPGLKPQPVSENVIKLVHSGIATRARNLPELIQAVKHTKKNITLDFFLLPGGDSGKHLQELQELARGNKNIVFKEAVDPRTLPAILNTYDAGIMFFKPNPKYPDSDFVLPNKFFDFIQARLAIITGPSIEMKTIIEEYDLGLVTNTFESNDIVAALDGLVPQKIDQWKDNSDKNAKELSYNRDEKLIRSHIQEMLAKSD